jgi:CheY-like chemotaxis protein
VKAEYSIPQDLWALEFDEGQIGQVINNLVLNSIQAMPNGGILHISADNKEINDNSKFPLMPGDYVVFRVKDKGIGIPEKYINQIFDPYFTTKSEGSGLGLATVHSIIAKHQGHITIQSKVGEGSTFSVFLPAIRDKQPMEVENVTEDIVYGTGKILLMDDEDSIRVIAKRILENLGYEVITTINGEETIQQYTNAMDSDQRFDLVVLDLTIPGGMGGKKTLDKLKELDPNLKAIVSSGYSVDPIMSDYQKHGFLGIIAKPYKIEDLSKVVDSVINGGS